MATSSDFSNPADKSTPGGYTPSQTAFLLLDFHNLFVQQAGGPNARFACETAAKFRTWAKSQGMHVIHCLIDLEGTPFPTCKNPSRFMSISSAMKVAEGGGGEPFVLTQDLGEDEATFTRRPGHVSALKSPGLEEYLQKNGIKSLVLSGLSTSGCVLRTAFAACDAEYVVTVLSDGCADSKQDVHDIVITTLLTNRGYVTSADEFMEEFAKGSG
ncbi:Isochorismatase-like protein [Lophiotrema nucula]|uniref:Isochorismatase-like protein n=1 Tax=Lophiotrema nucula TaxID=690887 RepID=A0A6A5YVB6_9PLEO|nr:Isochorismatase-like protein [Lophiotrema nucula]